MGILTKKDMRPTLQDERRTAWLPSSVVAGAACILTSQRSCFAVGGSAPSTTGIQVSSLAVSAFPASSSSMVQARSTSWHEREGTVLPAAAGLVSGLLASLAAVKVRSRPQIRSRKLELRGFRRDLSLEGYPVHGPGYYWTLSKCTSAIVIYIPIADDVNSRDVVFDCRDFTLKVGTVPEKGGLIINDKVLYRVDINESYFVIEEGEYGERCIMVWLSKATKEQDWYAYDRFEPKSERFLLEGEKKKAELAFTITHKAFLDIEIAEKPMGHIVIGLYGDICPRTVENFRCLCTGEKGNSTVTGEPLHYKGTRFHRVIPGFCIQGGQTFENEEGSGGESIYGPSFEDENLRVKFVNSGMIAMANGGPNTNGSQFFITTAKADHLSFKCVGFGEVIEGFEVVRAIESIGDNFGEPKENAVIVDCGELVFEDGEQERLASRRTRGRVDLTLRNEMINRVRQTGVGA